MSKVPETKFEVEKCGDVVALRRACCRWIDLSNVAEARAKRLEENWWYKRQEWIDCLVSVSRLAFKALVIAGAIFAAFFAATYGVQLGLHLVGNG